MRWIVSAVTSTALAMLGLAGIAQADTTISVPANNQAGSFGYPRTPTYGQTVTVPAGAPQLTSFTFNIEAPNDLRFRGEVFAWNNARGEATGPALFESGALHTSGSGFGPVTVSTGGLELVPGQTYVLFTTIDRDWAADIDAGTGEMQTNVSDAYSGGRFVWINDGGNPTRWTSGPWQQFGAGDSLAFSASFASTLASQSITFTSTPPAQRGLGSTYTPTATATSGLPVSFSIDPTSVHNCSITAGVVTYTGAGACVIDAHQPGNSSYLPAPQVQQTVGVLSYAQEVLADDPIGYWRLGDALDQSTMSDATGQHPGQYKNGAGGSLQLGIAGDGNHSALFVGNDQYGFVNNLADPSGSYSMEAWVLPHRSAGGMIMQQGASGALFINGAGQYVFVPDSNDVANQVIDTNPADRVPAAGAARFHQVVGTWNATTGVATLYVDGRSVATGQNRTAPSGSATLYIGYGSLAPWFSGYIDEAAYYGHALTPCRVLDHFEADPPPPLLHPNSSARRRAVKQPTVRHVKRHAVKRHTVKRRTRPAHSRG